MPPAKRFLEELADVNSFTCFRGINIDAPPKEGHEAQRGAFRGAWRPEWHPSKEGYVGQHNPAKRRDVNKLTGFMIALFAEL